MQLDLDLAIVNGRVLLPESGQFDLDIGVNGEKIVALAARGGLGFANRVVDARDLIVAPGVIDPHTHHGPYAPLEKDVEFETRAAIAGGVTTIGWFTRTPESIMASMPTMLSRVAGRMSTDYFVHPVIHTDEHLAELPLIAEEFGFRSFKAYMAGAVAVSDDFLLRLLRGINAISPSATLCVHAENGSLVEEATKRASETLGLKATLADWSSARPDFAGEEAIGRASFLADLASANVYFVHLNAAREVERVRQLKRGSSRIAAEAGAHYLSLTNDHPLGTLAKRNPPLRTAADVDALWEGVRDGVIDTIGTDNVVTSKELNDVRAGIFQAQVGFTSLGTYLPMALHEGHHKRGIGLERLFQVMSTTPAQIFGLYPRKGTIQIGSDADLVLIAPDLERTVDHSTSGTWSDFSPWDGMPLRGWPVTTILRGQVIAENHQVLSPPRGEYVSAGGVSWTGVPTVAPAATGG